MTYFLEYTVPAASNDAESEFPNDEIEADTTVPLNQTEADTVHTPGLHARTGILGATASEAKYEAEQLINHSRPQEARWFSDPSNSLQGGAGTLIVTFAEGRGWQDS